MNSMIPAFWQLFIVGPNISLVMLSCLQIPVKAPNTARGELETTYLDEDLRISRGDKGNLFILKMVDPSYTVPTWCINLEAVF